MSYNYLIVLDPSLNSSGYAVFNIAKKRPELVDYGTISNQHFASKEEGNKYINLDMRLQTMRFAYPNAHVLKEAWVGSATENGRKLATIHGLIHKVFPNTEIEEINNKSFKMEFTGNGDAEKEDVDKECARYESTILTKSNKIEKLVFKNDDESDSVGIGINWLIKKGLVKRVLVEQ